MWVPVFSLRYRLSPDPAVEISKINTLHRRSGIGMMTSASVHEGRAEEIHAARQAVFNQTFQTHPELFSKGHPKPPALPSPGGIIPQKRKSQHDDLLRLR